MKLKIHIFFTLFLSVSISLQVNAMSAKASIYTKAEIQSVDENSSDPSTQNFLYAVHHQSERAISSSTSNSLLTAENLTEEDTYGKNVTEKFRRWLSSAYLEKLGKREVSLTIKKLIFPFHSYL
jgi:hypothetical protein